MNPSRVELLVQTACIWEVLARKVGNVHRYTDFAGTGLLEFLLSAAAIAPHLHERNPIRLGPMIEAAVTATRNTVGQNTNLGIVLLLAPLSAVEKSADLRSAVATALGELTTEDTACVYRAIRSAAPGGLGRVDEQDVNAEPTVNLLEAMRLAADRDLIARQYANGYRDVFDFGVPAFLAALERFGCIEAAIIDCQLRWLTEYPDSLIVRKNGSIVAEAVQRHAVDVLSLGGITSPEGRRAGVILDRFLRSQGNRLNPGTTADLIAACLFVALRENKVSPAAPFLWHVPDWLTT